MSELTSNDEDRARALGNYIIGRLEQVIDKFENVETEWELEEDDALPILFTQGFINVRIDEVTNKAYLEAVCPCAVKWTGERFEVIYRENEE